MTSKLEDKKPFKCAVSADLFRRAMAAVSTEDTRYYLQGVFVEPCPAGGAMMTSTNGHWLINVHDPRGVVEGSGIVNLNRFMVAQLKSAATDKSGAHKRNTERALVVTHGGNPAAAKAMIVLSGRVYTPQNSITPIDPRQEALHALSNPGESVVMAQFHGAIIDGTYPDWKGRVVPKDANFSFPVPPIDHKYVAAAAASLSTDKRRSPVRMGGTDAGSPVVVISTTAREGWDGFAVVMPIRDDPHAGLPKYWIAP